jgi:hypothetical protein
LSFSQHPSNSEIAAEADDTIFWIDLTLSGHGGFWAESRSHERRDANLHFSLNFADCIQEKFYWCPAGSIRVSRVQPRSWQIACSGGECPDQICFCFIFPSDAFGAP